MIFRDSHEKNYTIVSNSILNRKDLSWKAKGILCYLLSCNDDAEFNHKWLEAMSRDSRDAVKAGIKELKEKGFINIKKCQDDKGKIYYEWFVYESPLTEKPLTEKPLTEKPLTENHQLSNKDNQYTYKSNTISNNLYINNENQESEEDRLPWEERKPSDEVFGKD